MNEYLEFDGLGRSDGCGARLVLDGHIGHVGFVVDGVVALGIGPPRSDSSVDVDVVHGLAVFGRLPDKAWTNNSDG